MNPQGAPALVLAVIAAAGVAACGSSGSSGSSSSSSGSSTASGASSSGSGTNIAVTETEFTIAPANPKIAKAGKVTFTVANKGKFPHALEIEGVPGEPKTPTLQPGKTATLQVDFTKAGTYTWYCPVDNHRQMGMVGKITVGGSSA